METTFYNGKTTFLCATIFIWYTINLYFLVIPKEYNENEKFSYLINTTNCQIPDLDPMNTDVLPYYVKQEYTPCRELPVLTYIEYRNENDAYLRINDSLISSYSMTNLNCCYSSITRGSIDKDNTISVSSCDYFKDSIKITSDLVKVSCRTFFNQEVYVNIHPILKSPKYIPKSDDSYNILLVGIDTMSRLNLQRTMPKTFKYLHRNNWIDLQGYNKIDDNTFPNLMAILTGMNLTQVNSNCRPDVNPLNDCDIIWNKYRDNGFLTAYAEDEASLNTFNYLLKGFNEPPVDYYFRPYFLGAETLLPVSHKYLMSYCTGPETSSERILHLINNYLKEIRNYPKFGLFWMNSFSHNNMNTAGGMDDIFENFWKNLHNNGLLDDSIIIFFSDHGFRFGKFVYTYSGWLEQRLPFSFIWVPPRFREEFPQKYSNLQTNSKRLTSPYDIYETLQDLIQLPKQIGNEIPKSLSCPKCQSLFDVIPEIRSCSDAGISQHWCTCKGHIYIDPETQIVREIADFLVEKLNRQIQSYGSESEQCSIYMFRRVITSGYRDNGETKYYLVIVEMLPEAVFEATVSVYRGSNFKLQGIINRVDRYSGKSDCISNRVLRTLCYCKNVFTQLESSIKVLFH